MRRGILTISIDDATRAFNAQKGGDWSKALDQVEARYKELVPEGIIQKRDNAHGIMKFMQPADWPLYRNLPEPFMAWLTSLLALDLDYDLDHVDGFRPEKMIPLEVVKRDEHNLVYIGNPDQENVYSDRTLYFEKFERDDVGYFFDPEGHLWSMAKIEWPHFGTIWHVVCQMPDDTDILDLLHVNHYHLD